MKKIISILLNINNYNIFKFSILFAFLVPAVAQANWDDAWTARSKITINVATISGEVDAVPVVVRLHAGNFSFIDAKTDGSDIRFVAADDKTELKYHVEKFDGLNQLAVLWVELPKIDPKEKDAYFWLYYGNEKAAPVADAKSSWDADTVAAFHFAEKALLQDSSASGLVATGAVGVQKAALLGEAAVFSGTPITVPAAVLANNTNGFTWSVWLKPTTIPQQATLLSYGDLLVKLDGNKLSLTSGKAAPVSGGEIKNAAWQHVALTVAAGKANVYINGVSVASADVTLAAAPAEMQVGVGYTGELDELELAKVVRSADWLKLAASGQGADSKLLTVVAEDAEEEGGEGAGYMSILIKSLTPDAKIVIAILSVMFAISTAVMIAKARLVGRTDKDNAVFLSAFQNADDDLLNLDKVNAPNSTLYQLYNAGLREIRKREKSGEKLALAGSAIDAIKAAIDADLVRETQRMNGKMVLLTIAISGGPFLGLLGTVVGVMITFAAIAAAGDVNVNAIAPGIAAALLATVAGLGVAIPALFGYNYLASRIKNITIEMQIFVDEFVTRVAELYGH